MCLYQLLWHKKEEKMNKAENKVIHDREWARILSKARHNLECLGKLGTFRIEELDMWLCDFSKKYSSYEKTGFNHSYSKKNGRFNFVKSTIQIRDLKTIYGTIPFIEFDLSTLSLSVGKSKYSYATVSSSIEKPELVKISYSHDYKNTYETFPEKLQQAISDYVKTLNSFVRQYLK